MPTTDFAALAIELKDVQQKLAHTTYSALFAPTPDARAQAVVEAGALNACLENMLCSTFKNINQLVRFMRQPEVGSPLQTAYGLMLQLESLSAAWPTKMGTGSGAGCPATCASAPVAN